MLVLCLAIAFACVVVFALARISAIRRRRDAPAVLDEAAAAAQLRPLASTVCLVEREKRAERDFFSPQ